jgi:uncharacterized protein (TIRG00374 family)
LKSIGPIIKYILLLAVAGLLLWLAFRGQDLRAIGQQLLNANYTWVLLSVIVSILAHYARALRWKMLIKPLGFAPSNANMFHSVMIGYLANLAVPRMGEVSRCGVLTRTDKIPLNSLIGTVIIERIIDVLFLLGILFLSIIIEYNTIQGFLFKNIIDPFVNKFQNAYSYIYIIVILIVLILAFVFILKKYHQKLLSNKVYKKIWEILLGFRDGILSVLKLEKKGLFILYSVFIWLMYTLSTWLCFFAIEPTSQLSLSSALFIMAVGGIGMSAPVQGGIGAYEAAIQLALLVYGINSSDGLIYATLNHSSQILSILLVGSISLLFIFINYKKNENNS